ncbi:MAG: PA2779 family protein [Acidobacteriales bacterium]|nr:PA2779 family protein [Terriglobales bacterium]
MKIHAVWQFVRSLAVCVLAPILCAPPELVAQTHIVSPSELQREAVAATSTRQHNTETITNFLSSPKAKEVLSRAGIDQSQVKNAVSTLNDGELARLAARSEKAQADFAAGSLSDRDLLIVMLGLVALVLLIVAVR